MQMSENKLPKMPVSQKPQLEHRLKHSEGGFEIGGKSRGGITTIRITKHCILDHYAARGYVTEDERVAGDRLFRDFSFSAQTAGVTSQMDSYGVRSNPLECKLTESQMDARDRWRKAIDAVGGKIGQLMVLNVCCYGYGLNDINYMRYNNRSSWDRFHEALDDLMKHYNGE